MSQLIRTELTIQTQDAVPKDYSTHVVYHTANTNLVDPTTDWGNHAQEVLDAFTGAASGYTDVLLYSKRKVTAKVYDMSDAKPRPEKAAKVYTPSTWDTNANMFPGQIALCMSFFASRNIVGSRGRLYLGPFNSASVGNSAVPRPPSGLRSQALSLGHALFDIGGENIAWVLAHEKVSAHHAAGTTQVITDIWCDDSFDVQRRRKQAATTRSTLTP